MKKIEYTIPELTLEQEQDIAWTKEEVEFLPVPNCTYQEVFMLVYGMNKHLGEKKAKEYAIQKIIWIYEFNNNKLPEGIEHERTYSVDCRR